MMDLAVEDVTVEQEEAVRTRTRRCIATRAPRPAQNLIRFVVGPNSTLVPDLAGRLPGRGMWVDANRQVLARALARNQFAKAAKAAVLAPADLVDHVQAMLLRRCLDLVGLARRAGELVVGFDQVEDWLRRGRCGLVLTSSDGSADGRRRIEALAGVVPVLARSIAPSSAVRSVARRPSMRDSPIAASPASCSTSSGGCMDFVSSACPSGMPSATQ